MSPSKRKTSASRLASTQVLIAVVAGLLSVVFQATGSSPTAIAGAHLGDFFSIFVHLPLFLAGLSFGTPAVLMAGVSGLVGTALFAPDSIYVGKYFLTVALPAIGITYLALQNRTSGKKVVWYPATRLMIALTAYGAALVPIFYYLFTSVAALNTEIRDTLSQMLTQMQISPMDLGVSPEGFYQSFLPIYIGFMVLNLLLVVVSNGVVAQYILKKSSRALRPPPSLTEVEGSRKISLLVGGAMLGIALLKGMVTALLLAWLLVLLLPLTLTGLSMLHRRMAGVKNKMPLLTLFYVVFVLLMPLPLFVVCFFGLLGPVWAQKKY